MEQNKIHYAYGFMTIYFKHVYEIDEGDQSTVFSLFI